MIKKQDSKWNGNIPIGSLVMLVVLISHTIFFLLFEFYSMKLYILAASAATSLMFMYYFEKSCPTLMNIGSNIICGIWWASLCCSYA